MIKPEVYAQAVLDTFGVTVPTRGFAGNSKWSERARSEFQQQGKIWDDNIKAQLKSVVASTTTEYGQDPFAQPRGDIMNRIITVAEQRLKAAR